MSTQLAEPAAPPTPGTPATPRTTGTLGTLDAIYRRRAVRNYLPDPLDNDTIRRLLDAAVQAPTAMHAEPWSFIIVQDKAMLQWLSDRAKALMVEEATAHRELLRAPGASPAGEHLTMLVDPSFNIFYNAGTLIVICASPLDEFVTADCWLAAENLMLAACALGLGTCCIGFALPALRTTEVKKELGIRDAVEPVAAIIVGVPSGEPKPVSRKPPEIVRWFRPSSSR